VAAYDQLRADHHDTLAALAVAGTALPPELRGPVELALARRLEAELAELGDATDPAAFGGVRAVVREAREEGVHIGSPRSADALERALVTAVDNAVAERTPAAVEAAVGMVALARELSVPVDLGVAQEHIHEALYGEPIEPPVHELLRPLGLALGLSG
jgi:hypothetical protein